MENRFTLKDLFFLLLLLAVIIVVLLAMKQYDRQYALLRELRDNGRRQTAELAEISRLLRSGRLTTATTDATTRNVPQVFARIEAARAKTDYAAGDWFIDSIGNTEKLTPLTSTDAYAADVQGRVLESLATRDPVTLEWVGLLAEHFETSSDGLTIRFRLRPGLVFSDGQPLTADDVVFTYQWIMNPAVDAPRERAYYKLIETVEKSGERDVVFRYKEPYFKAFDFAGGMPILPRHFYSRFTPEQFNQAPGLLLGSGQYRMENPETWSPGKPIVLYRNERYWGTPAGFERIVYKNLDSDLARLTAFRNGEVDGLFSMQTEPYLELKRDANLVARTQQFAYDSPTSGYRYIAWNQKRNGRPTRFADARVRRAMTLLTDRPRMLKDLLSGLGTPITGPFHPASPQHDPAIAPWPYDPAQARALLAEAGYADRNGDGVIESADGVPFRFKLTYPSGIPSYQQMALDLKDSYARAGIALEPEPLDWSVFRPRLKNKDFDAISLGWSAGIEGDIYQMFHSSQIEGGGDNFMSYASDELDRVIEQARRTVDKEARMQLWHQAERILHADQPYTFLFVRQELAFIDARIKNIQKLPLGLNPMEEWYVPTGAWKWMK